MTILGKFTKQPVEVLDYQFDFSAWLADRRDTISSATVTSAPLTAGGASPLVISSIANAYGIVRFFAAGGTDGVKYEVSCTITTASTPARVKQDELIIAVKET